MKFNSILFAKDMKIMRLITRNITMREVQEETNISAATICRVENEREPDITTFAVLCAWLGTKMEDYFTN